MLVALGALVLGERPTRGRLLWLAVAFAGVLLIVQGRQDAGHGGRLIGLEVHGAHYHCQP